MICLALIPLQCANGKYLISHRDAFGMIFS